MATDSETIFTAAMQLPEQERLSLAFRLMDTLPEEAGLSLDDPNLVLELDRRFADTACAISWSDLHAES